jgi:8-oxo-dGTP pyrophosphatase MutT (NUDIX family)
VAALREAFEETGILVGTRRNGEPLPGAGEDAGVARVRDLLVNDEITFPQALDQLDADPDASAVEYVAHWITPVQEPRRYDTRFFAAQVAPERRHLLHEAEMSEGLWISPAAALERHVAGDLPMVFPTIRTLEGLRDFASAASALEAFSRMEITAILPRLVKTPTGVGLEVP